MTGEINEFGSDGYVYVDGFLEIKNLYVRKSVANVLRNASRAQPDFVLRLCTSWAQSDSQHTRWISREGLRKLKTLRPQEVAAILKSLARSA